MDNKTIIEITPFPEVIVQVTPFENFVVVVPGEDEEEGFDYTLDFDFDS